MDSPSTSQSTTGNHQPTRQRGLRLGVFDLVRRCWPWIRIGLMMLNWLRQLTDWYSFTG